LNTRLKCLLLDDELPGLSYLKLLCEQLPELEVIKAYNNPEIFMEEFPSLDFDLCILDIEMPGINGIQLAGLLKDKLVIFTTAYKDYAADAFDLDVVDYVVKPVKFERLKQAINKAIQRLGKDDRIRKHTWLNTDKGKTLIYFDELAYIKTSDIDSRDKTVFLTNNHSFQLKNISFKKLIALLPPHEFCRINKKELIAMRCVQSYFGEQIITNIYLEGNKPLTLLLGESYRTEFVHSANL